MTFKQYSLADMRLIKEKGERKGRWVSHILVPPHTQLQLAVSFKEVKSGDEWFGLKFHITDSVDKATPAIQFFSRGVDYYITL